jgi:hypothetical protein
MGHSLGPLLLRWPAELIGKEALLTLQRGDELCRVLHFPPKGGLRKKADQHCQLIASKLDR